MRVVLVVVALLGVAAFVWALVGDRGRPGDSMGRTTPADGASAAPGGGEVSAASGGATASGSRDGRLGEPGAKRPRPRLPTPAAAPTATADGSLALAERPLFAESGAERRDPAWATATEAAIRERLDELLDGVDQPTVPQLECRETVCRMLVASGDQGALRRFMAELNSRRGFVGDAEMLAFEDVERRDDASGAAYHAVRVMLVYRR